MTRDRLTRQLLNLAEAAETIPADALAECLADPSEFGPLVNMAWYAKQLLVEASHIKSSERAKLKKAIAK